MNKKLISIAVIFLTATVSCTNEETLDTALAIGAQTTSIIFIDECTKRFKELPITKDEARKMILAGINESQKYFISIGDEKWIDEAVDIGNSSLKKSIPTMSQEKCKNFITAIVKDGGIQKGKRFRDYYSSI